MSQTLDAETLLQTRGVHRMLDAYVVGAAFERGGEFATFALGDGSLHFASLAEPKEDWSSFVVHDGAILSVAADVVPGAIVTGGDDGDFPPHRGDWRIDHPRRSRLQMGRACRGLRARTGPGA